MKENYLNLNEYYRTYQELYKENYGNKGAGVAKKLGF